MNEPEPPQSRKVPMIPIAICVFIGGLVLMIGLVMFHQANQTKPEEQFYYHPPDHTILPSDAKETQQE